jgi:hypothetical protein
VVLVELGRINIIDGFPDRVKVGTCNCIIVISETTKRKIYYTAASDNYYAKSKVAAR